MNDMKIGIYDPYLDDVGGGEKYILTAAVCLAKGNDVTLFWDNPEDLRHVQDRFSLDLSGIKIEKNIFSGKVPLLARIRESAKFDIMIFLSDGSFPFVLSKKLFLHIQQPLKTIQGISIKNFIKFKRINAVFCNSEYTKSFNQSRLPVKTIVINPPIDLYPKKMKRENIILHVGRFRPNDLLTGAQDYKKQYVMIDAFKDMVDNDLKEWKFILAVSVKDEDNDQFNELKKKIKDYPIEFLVNLSNKKLWDYYSKAKIYWHASGYGEDLDKHPEFAEHFGISTVEAMGAGVVPVVINAGGQKEIVTDGVNGLLWNTLEELKNKTLSLMKNNLLWKKLSENAQERAKEYAGERFCREIYSLIGQ